MVRKIAFLTFTLALLPVVGNGFYLGGIQVNEPDHLQWVKALKREQMNTVAVTAYARQGRWDTDHLWFDRGDQENVRGEIRIAKKHGLQVVMVLRTALDHAFPRNKFLWHGMIMPLSDRALRSWFDQYTRFVLYWARLAEEEGVDVLAVAGEMNSLASTIRVASMPKLHAYYLDESKQRTEISRILSYRNRIQDRHLWVRGFENYSTLEAYLNDRQRAQASWAVKTAFSSRSDPLRRINERRDQLDRLWRNLIKDMRQVFRGRLTYAANFDQYHEVGFWDALDLIGINAYFPLRDEALNLGEQEMRKALRKGWQGVFEKLEGFCKRRDLHGMPVVFTEIGYTRRKHCTVRPWADQGFSLLNATEGRDLIIWQDQPLEPRERAMAMDALYQTASRRDSPSLAGLLYWKLSTNSAHRCIEPFVCVLESSDEPMLRSLQNFSSW